MEGGAIIVSSQYDNIVLLQLLNKRFQANFNQKWLYILALLLLFDLLNINSIILCVFAYICPIMMYINIGKMFTLISQYQFQPHPS